MRDPKTIHQHGRQKNSAGKITVPFQITNSIFKNQTSFDCAEQEFEETY